MYKDTRLPYNTPFSVVFTIWARDIVCTSSEPNLIDSAEEDEYGTF